MKSKAIQQLLTVTALAWAGQGHCQAGLVEVAGNSPSTSQDAGPTAGGEQQAVRFSASGRAAVASWLRANAVHAGGQPALQRGQLLPPERLLVARTLPAHLLHALQTPGHCVDLLLGNTLVRLDRLTRRVVDCGAETV